MVFERPFWSQLVKDMVSSTDLLGPFEQSGSWFVPRV